MTQYHVVFSEEGKRDLLMHLEGKKDSARVIAAWITKYLEQCKNPRAHGKRMGIDGRIWKYTVGRYRLLARIQDNRIVILAIAVSLNRGN